MAVRRVAAVVVAVAVVVAALSFEPVRTAAGEFLDVFRVKRLKVVTITPQDMAQLQELLQRGGTADLESFGRVDVTGEAASRTVTASEAEEALGYPLRLPHRRLLGPYEDPLFQLDVLPTVSLTLNVGNVNTFLRSLGSRDLLPATLEGKTFTIKGYPVCTAIYRSRAGHLRVIQGRSPELIVPPGVDVAAVRTALLGIPGLPENLSRQLESITDWRHTLPIPAVEGTCIHVTVNGSPGVFWSIPEDQPPSGASTPGTPTHPSTLFWEEDGVLYAIQGRLLLSQAMDLARSMGVR
ncbi:MAG: hypothetical protein QME87_07525 [Bacillota bacterium]|nr:hypothetical protein [Bacillota bacterium]